LSANDLASGVYFLRISSESSLFTTKIIVE
jgi:hypothetical protein